MSSGYVRPATKLLKLTQLILPGRGWEQFHEQRS